MSGVIDEKVEKYMFSIMIFNNVEGKFVVIVVFNRYLLFFMFLFF